VPNGSSVDMTEPILSQLERFAPGLRKRVIGRSAMGPATIEAFNANHVGGDINGGLPNITQLITRPAIRLDPYATPDRSIFICSSSTPPGGGVHGLCGYHAAQSALRGILR
jgi:phytoene dehydrogenase-like protein